MNVKCIKLVTDSSKFEKLSRTAPCLLTIPPGCLPNIGVSCGSHKAEDIHVENEFSLADCLSLMLSECLCENIDTYVFLELRCQSGQPLKIICSRPRLDFTFVDRQKK